MCQENIIIMYMSLCVCACVCVCACLSVSCVVYVCVHRVCGCMVIYG